MNKKPNYEFRPEIAFLCEYCATVQLDSDLKIAPNPFKPEHNIYGCKHCGEVDGLDPICDVVDCTHATEAGRKYEGDYHRVCGHHYEMLKGMPE